MKNRNIFAILCLVVLALGVISIPAIAQDEEMEEEGRAYGVPEGYEAEESTNGTITLTSGDNIIIITSEEAYTQFLGTQEFETDVEELTFFLDRANYSVGSEQDVLPTGATAGVGVTLTRRDTMQTGLAYLYDTGLERFAVISLHDGRGQIGAPPDDVETVVADFVFVGSIVDVAIENAAGGNEDRAGLSYLVAAIENADSSVMETLSGEGSYTVFAPSNQAFINLFSLMQSEYGMSISDLMSADSQALLTQVLLYHVVDGEVMAADVMGMSDGGVMSTLLGDEQNGIVVNFRSDGTAYLNGGIDLVATDIQASNGVVHIIDDVLLPQCVLDTLAGTGSCGIAAEESSDS